jgi:GntR family transcriptional regulator / MocR family aminotransferase
MLGIVLDRSLPRNLASQLCDALRSAILSGSLAEGTRLPSSRELSRELGLSRTLVLEAFEQLEAEGYVEGRRGSGSYVLAGSAPARAKSSRRASKADHPPGNGCDAPVTVPSGAAAQAVDFRTGTPALDAFPREAWARALAQAARELPREALGYGDGAGLMSLREATTAYLFRSRGLELSPEELFVSSGISQTLGMVSRMLLKAGSRAVLENPCQPALSGLLRREGVELVAGRVDGEGLDAARLPRDRAAVAFVTPSHQFPLGAVLSARRRAALVEWARATDSVIVEDDFDGEFRYGGAPLPPLRELAPERVVYAGSFSKAFSPALRLGYAVLPPRLRGPWRACRELADIHSCSYAQAAMAGFLESGAFDRHVRRMKKLYASRRAALLGGVAALFGPGRVEALGEAAGIHVALRFEGEGFEGLSFDEGTLARIASAGAIVYPASRYAFSPFPGIGRIALLGYGNLSEERIGQGLAALASGLFPGRCIAAPLRYFRGPR